MLDTQRIVSELKAEVNRLERAIAALDGTNTAKATLATKDTGTRTQEASPSYCGRTQAAIYADEKAMGGKKEEDIRPKIRDPTSSDLIRNA